MGISTSTFYDPKQARRRRLIYLLCALVVAGCGVAFLLSQKGDPANPGDRADSGATDSDPIPDPAPDPGGPAANEPAPPPDPNPDRAPEPAAFPSNPKRRALDEAQALFDDGMVHLKAAMSAEPGSDEAGAERRLALDGLLAAQEAFEAYLEEYPEAERALDRKLADLQSQIYWCRKSMAATEFPATGSGGSGGGKDPGRTDPPPARAGGSRPGPTGTTPPPSRPEPAFAADEALARFIGAARRAFREGRPDRVTELGRPLLEDPRMEEHQKEIRLRVELAAGMEHFLEAPHRTLVSRIGQETTLRLRREELTGTLQEVGDEIVLNSAGGQRRLRIGDLSAEQLLTLAEVSGYLWTGEAHLSVGSFFLLRGDAETGSRHLLLARAEGQDVTVFDGEIERQVGRSAELKALVAYLDLAPLVSAGKPELVAAVDRFKAAHHGSRSFADNRERLFRAVAEVVAKHPYEIGDLWSGPVKVSGKSFRATWEFDSDEEIGDFGTVGEWRVEDGALTGKKGTVWTERFLPGSLDFRFVLDGAAPVTAGIWSRNQTGRKGVILDILPDPSGLVITLRHADRKIGQESVRVPNGKLEFRIQKKGDKYQVSLNRRVVLKAKSLANRDFQSSVGLGFMGHDADIRVDEVEIKADLDLDWANAGGGKYATWILDWLVAGPFPLPDKSMAAALARPYWPEERTFDPTERTEDGKPAWAYKRATSLGIDLNRSFKPNDNVVGYAAIRVWSPDRRAAILEAEADDAARVWLNGEAVMMEAPLGSTQKVAVKLNPGENVLLTKVVERKGAFWIRARLLSKSGELMRDVQYW